MELIWEKIVCLFRGHSPMLIQRGIGKQCLNCGKFWSYNMDTMQRLKILVKKALELRKLLEFHIKFSGRAR